MNRRNLLQLSLGLLALPFAKILPKSKKDEWFIRSTYTVTSVCPRTSVVFDYRDVNIDREEMERMVKEYEQNLKRCLNAKGISCRVIEIRPGSSWMKVHERIIT